MNNGESVPTHTPPRTSVVERLRHMPSAQAIHADGHTEVVRYRLSDDPLDAPEIIDSNVDMPFRKIDTGAFQQQPLPPEEAYEGHDNEWLESQLRMAEEEGARQAEAEFEVTQRPAQRTLRLGLDGPDESFDITIREGVNGARISGILGIMAGQPVQYPMPSYAVPVEPVPLPAAVPLHALGAQPAHYLPTETAQLRPTIQSQAVEADGYQGSVANAAEQQSGQVLNKLRKNRKAVQTIIGLALLPSLFNVSTEFGKQRINGTTISMGDVWRKALFMDVDTRASIEKDRLERSDG